MPMTFLELQDEVMDMIDADDTTTRAHVKNFINRSAKDIWTAHPWRERRKEGEIRTFAPYSTGTVTATLGSATVTGSGTTFPTTYTNTLFRFGLSFASNFYPVTTRDSATQLTLSSNFHEATTSGASYVVWQDVYRLATDVDTLIEVRLQHPGFDGPLAATTEQRLDEVAYQPGQSSQPKVWAMVAPSSAGVKQVRLWPVPDDTYRLPYRYLATYTDMSADGDECVLPENFRDLIVCGALRWAYRLKGQYQKAMAEVALFRTLLAEARKTYRDVSPQAGRIRTFDQPSRVRQLNIDSIVLS